MKTSEITPLDGLNMLSWHPEKNTGIIKKRTHMLQDGDYASTDTLDNGIKVGSCSIEGWKDEQQDCLDAESIKDFERLTDEQRKDALIKTFRDMQTKLGNRETGGSSANATLSWIENNAGKRQLHIYNAHVGDSTAHLVILDDKEVVSSIRINKTLHNPATRLLAGDGWRLAMDRSIGDRKYEKVGLKHDADITSIQIDLLPTQRAFIVAASAGLTEEAALDEKSIAQIIQQNKSSLKETAIELVKAAVLGQKGVSGSQDNISVSVAEILPGKNPASLAIFDGHGESGEDVAFGLGKLFHKSLQEFTTKAMPKVSLLTQIYATLFGSPVVQTHSQTSEAKQTITTQPQ